MEERLSHDVFSTRYCRTIARILKTYHYVGIILSCIVFSFVALLGALLYNLPYILFFALGMLIGLAFGQLVAVGMKITGELLLFMANTHDFLRQANNGGLISKNGERYIPESFAEKVLNSYSGLIEKFEQEKEFRLHEKDRIIEEWKKATKRREEILSEKDRKIAQMRLQKHLVRPTSTAS